VLVDGLADTKDPVVVFKLIPGDHVYVLAPVADNKEDCPLHIEAEFALKIGNGFTITVEMASFEHPSVLPTTV
jgi:hypothetical protein